jgi:hypothetical protein
VLLSLKKDWQKTVDNLLTTTGMSGAAIGGIIQIDYPDVTKDEFTKYYSKAVEKCR